MSHLKVASNELTGINAYPSTVLRGTLIAVSNKTPSHVIHSPNEDRTPGSAEHGTSKY